jgi:hypothetical protein
MKKYKAEKELSKAQIEAWEENYTQFVLMSCISQLKTLGEFSRFSHILPDVAKSAKIALAHIRILQEDRIVARRKFKKESQNVGTN